MLSIAILDDDQKTLDDYKKMIPVWLKRNNIEGDITCITNNYKQFIKDIRKQHANVCILDINLKSEANGLSIARLIRKENMKIEIIFCTGMLEYVTSVFEVQPYNFILKSNSSTLEKCLVKLADDIKKRDSGTNTLEIKFGSRIYYLPLNEIVQIQSIGKKCIITSTSRTIETIESLDSLQAKLNNQRFKRCHRSAMVNSEYIDYVDMKEKFISLRNGSKCELGPKYYNLFKYPSEWSESHAY